MDTFAMVPPVGIAELHMDPPDPLPYVGGHSCSGTAEQAIDDPRGCGRSGSGSIIASVELRHIGGELARDRPPHGALSTLPGDFVLFAVGGAFDPQMAAAGVERIERLTAAMAAYDVGRYANFTEARCAPGDCFPAATVARLEAAKAAYDRDGLIRANHAISATR
jgi:hypothetical protein